MAEGRKPGEPVPDWKPCPAPGGAVLEGRYARLERLSADRHAALLFRSFEGHDAVWDYLPYGPFHSAAAYHRWTREMAAKDDPLFYAIKDLDTGQFGGVASYLRITPDMGVIELGHINLSPALQKTRAATEAFCLMMKWAFDHGYRRFEWKCDAANTGSRRAAQRLGLSFEGVFRQHLIVKGRNRDTAWFAATDREWPALEEAFRFWLSPGNFDAAGRQKERLADLAALVRVASDPAL
ncbi:MAG: GNAT family protein [Thalassovita sp.]|nr:GNAT family protein [Thalassovita sp.]